MREPSVIGEPNLVDVNGDRVFNAAWTLQQMRCLMRSLERAKTMARWSLFLTAVAVLISLVAFSTR